jgi:hypothetical protein
MYIISFNHSNSSIFIERTANISKLNSSLSSIPSSIILSKLYLSACDEPYNDSKASMAPISMQDSANISTSRTSFDTLYPVFAATKKKYKPVALKVRPVITNLPDWFCIIRNIIGDPLEHMPSLNPHPPPFTSSPRYNAEQKAIVDKNHPGDFLWPEECNLMHDFIRKHETALAWNENE